MCSWAASNYITSYTKERLLQEALHAVDFMQYTNTMSNDFFIGGELLHNPEVGTPMKNHITEECGYYLRTQTEGANKRALLIGIDGDVFR